MSDNTSQQDVIERDLERTRSRMDNRLSELQERLSPGQIVDDLLGYFRGSEGGDFARNLMDSVRDNPLPAALTGIGLTWLMASNPKPRPAFGEKGGVSSSTDSRTWTSQEEFDRHFRELEQGVARQTDDNDTAYRFRIDEARGKALGVARQPDDTAESFSQRVQQAFTAAGQSVIKISLAKDPLLQSGSGSRGSSSRSSLRSTMRLRTSTSSSGGCSRCTTPLARTSSMAEAESAGTFESALAWREVAPLPVSKTLRRTALAIRINFVRVVLCGTLPV